ncbi:hypothetical protein UNH65_26645 [Chitinophaga sp. 180180018-2]|nr:hypothetical protein [Chitinophaga sp. 212800010-3]
MKRLNTANIFSRKCNFRQYLPSPKILKRQTKRYTLFGEYDYKISREVMEIVVIFPPEFYQHNLLAKIIFTNIYG